MRTVLGHAVTLIVGQDDQTAGVAHGIVAGVVDEHAYVGHPREMAATLVVLRGALEVAGDGDMAADNQVVGLGHRVVYQHPRGHGHQRRQRHLVAVGIHRGISVGVELGARG